MEKKKNIGVLGLGRLGIAFSLLCADNGYQVFGYDISKNRLESIENKTLKTSEPEIEDLLSKNTINICKSVGEVFQNTDLVFILVATPSLPNDTYDHSSIDRIVKEIRACGILNKTVVISCTTMPKYCDSVKRMLSHLGHNVLYNPEFIQQFDIINGLKNADIVLIGGSPTEEVYQLYRDIMVKEPDFKVLSLTGAELAKIGINCFLTLKITYANMIGDIAIKSEVEEIDTLLETISSDSRIGKKFFKYGFPSSGLCLPRDVRALNKYTRDLDYHEDITFIDSIIDESKSHLLFMKEQLLNKNPNKSTPFIFSHITYKPNTDILTESKQLELCLELLKEGYTVYIPHEQLKLNLPKELREYEERGWLKGGYQDMKYDYFSGDSNGVEKRILKGYQVN